MHEPRGVSTDDLGQMGQKGDDVMLGDGLDLVDPGDVEFGVTRLPHGFGIGFGDHAKGRLRVTGMGLDLEPDLELGFWRPDGNHVGAGIARDHRMAFQQLGLALP